jgi:hypothetical protein
MDGLPMMRTAVRGDADPAKVQCDRFMGRLQLLVCCRQCRIEHARDGPSLRVEQLAGQVVVDPGPATGAMRASCASPSVMRPARYKRKRYKRG